jgi:drug/metabolite transporter (DMT)-like permease
MQNTQNQRLGIYLMIATTVIFALQDGISRHLVAQNNVFMVVMIRFWFFAAFVMALAARGPGGLRAAARSRRPGLQIFRGALLVAEVCVMVVGFVKLGLIESHAVFICYPLLIAALSGPILGEAVGWRRWAAIGVGFAGVLIILQPGYSVFSPWTLLPLASALMFALYGLLTRYVARYDSAQVSYFWTGVAGAAAITPLGLWFWQPMAAGDWAWMATLCVTAALGHWLLIRAYAVAEASAIQPFAYLQLVWASMLGMVVFGESLQAHVALGAGLVIAAGLFTLWRERLRARATALAPSGAGPDGRSAIDSALHPCA